MTAFILKPFHDRIEVLSDGAMYDPEGILLGVYGKVRMSEFVPLVVVGSGEVRRIEAIADRIMHSASVTHSVDATLEILSDALAEISLLAENNNNVRIAIGAISETKGPTCLVFSAFEDPSSGHARFELQEMPSGFGQGDLPDISVLVAKGVRSGESLEKHALFFFEHMRRTKMISPISPEKEPFYSVGGHLDFTVVHTDWYEHRVLHTWPDEIGQKIDPFKGEVVAA